MRYALTYGLLSGAVILASILAGLTLSERDGFFTSQWAGYLIMLVALMLVFVGVKRYRDVERGGVIGFWRALGMALAIVGVAATAYVILWEIYLAATGYVFFDQYIASQLEQMRASGAPADAIARKAAEFDSFRAWYDNPLIRMPITFMEMMPVAIPVAFVTAALLRNPRLLPSRERSPAKTMS